MLADEILLWGLVRLRCRLMSEGLIYYYITTIITIITITTTIAIITSITMYTTVAMIPALMARSSRFI